MQCHRTIPGTIFPNQEAVCVFSSLLGTTELLAFMTAHGYNPISPTPELSFWEITGDYDEELISTDPFRAKFTVVIDDDALALMVDENFDVIETAETDVSDST